MREGELLWEPPAEVREATQLAQFMAERGFETYAEVWEWSVSDLDGFWGAVWDRFGVMSSAPHTAVLGSREMPGAEWFPGARLNYAEHALRHARPGEAAIVHASESQPLAEVTWDELSDQVARCAAGLRRLGVERGDRVAAYLPNAPEATIAFLACASIGAIWSSCAPEFGVPTVIDRFQQIEPRVLLAVEDYRYGGKDFDRRDRIVAIDEALPSVEHVVAVPSGWDELLSEPAELVFEQVPFDHPLWVLYSSGTTGLPKAIVQSHGGILIEQLKKLHLHMDLGSRDRLFWFTTTGWMMWNFLMGGLLTGATIVLWDGKPDPEGMWKLAEEAEVTVFGTSAGFITACMKAGVEPGKSYDLSKMRMLGSTGSPLPVEGYRWVYEHVSADVWLVSTSGGTDVCTAFVGGVPVLPVYAGELQGRSLGAALRAFDVDGHELIGEVGELVITEPMPSMPIYFWGDDDGSRYRESYFEDFPGVWRHGDWIKINERGGAVIYGRSDSTINRQGVRMGTSELYSAVEVEEVADSLVIDVPSADASDSVMWLFVVVPGGLTPELEQTLKRRLRENCSPRHVPDRIVAIDAVPYTLSGKKLEVPIKKLLMGADPKGVASRDSLANPEAFDAFVALAAEQATPAAR